MSMLRVLAFSLCLVLLYALYLPAVHPPERFAEQLQIEHEHNVAFWGERRAHQLLERSLTWFAQHDALLPAAVASPSTGLSDRTTAAVTQQMSEVVARLFHNPYTRAFDALLLLSTYRLASLLLWSQWLAAFVLIACVDGYVVRWIRSKDFRAHSPLHFALCVAGATLALAFTLVLLVIPLSVEPLLMGGVLLLLGVLLAVAIGHFHR